MTREEVLRGVRECVAGALDREAGEIGEHQRLIGDLGAESLDLLDLTFQLERRFHVRISPREMERRGRAKLNGVAWEVDGVLTDAARAELRAAMPETPAEEIRPGLTVDEVPRLFRVATMVNLIERLVAEQETAARARM
jgi:acyl carrier protein